MIPILGFVAVVVLLWWAGRRLLAALARGAVTALAARSAAEAGRRLRPAGTFLARRFPRASRIVARRFDPGRFTGLPLSLLAAACLYLAALFAGLADELREADELNRIDEAIRNWFEPIRESPSGSVLIWLTRLGDPQALVAVSVVATGFLWAHGRRRLILPLWVTIAGAHATTWLGKFGFARTRPEFLTEITALSPSFPSGHATGALAVYGFIAFAVGRDLPAGSLRARYDLTFWTLLLVLLIGFSRIFLSVHFASDVAAGYLVGGFWLLVGFALAEWRRPPAAY